MKFKREMKKHEEAHKDMLVKEINRLLKDCTDVELIQLVYMLLLKSN